MALNGYVVGFSESSGTNPNMYWDGTNRVDNIDNAMFFETIGEARTAAAGRQAAFLDVHVEAYAATLSLAHAPALPSSGPGGV